MFQEGLIVLGESVFSITVGMVAVNTMYFLGLMQAVGVFFASH